MEEQTILDMCQSHNVKVSIEYDYDWGGVDNYDI